MPGAPGMVMIESLDRTRGLMRAALSPPSRFFRLLL